jgi:hypothetical protein
MVTINGTYNVRFKQISPKIFRYGTKTVEIYYRPTYYIIPKDGQFRRLFYSFYKLVTSAVFFGQSCKENIWLFKYTVELHLSGLIEKASHPDMQKIRILGFFFWSLAVLYSAVTIYSMYLRLNLFEYAWFKFLEAITLYRTWSYNW